MNAGGSDTHSHHRGSDSGGMAATASVDDTTYSEDEGSWLLEHTLRHHEARTRTYGVLRCELWLSRRRRNEHGHEHELDGTSGEFEDVSSDAVELWRWKGGSSHESPSSSSPSKTNPNRLYPSKQLDGSAPTLLGERLANRLWDYHKDRYYETRIPWRRFNSLTDSEAPWSHHSRQVHWVAAICFEVPAVVASRRPSLAAAAEDTAASSCRGMVCWLVQSRASTVPRRRSSNARQAARVDEEAPQASAEHPPPPPTVEPFLRAATSHIAATYALESFGDLPLPPGGPAVPSAPRKRSISSTNETLGTESTRTKASSQQKQPRTRRQRLPSELCYNDEDMGGDDDSIDSRDEEEEEEGDEDFHGDEDETKRQPRNKCLAVLWAYLRKFKGGGFHGPQPLCWKQTLFTFVGTFVCIYTIGVLNEAIEKRNRSVEIEAWIKALQGYEEETGNHVFRGTWATLTMGPFGATCILIFAMTTAAPSQPRNVLVGISVGMLVGKLVGLLEFRGVGLTMRMALATALAAAIQAKTCTLFPPGGALALIFSSDVLGWDKFVLQFLGSIVCVCLGLVINNLHPYRTYPTFWLGLEGCRKGDKEDDDKDTRRETQVGGCRSRF